MRMDLNKLWSVTVMVLLLLPVFAQEKKAAVISGMVKDSRTKSPLNEAIVTLSSNAFEGQKFALTNSTGMYKVSNLPPGYYTISFEMEGFKKFAKDSIRLQEGMSLGVSFEMAGERKGKDREIKQTENKVIAVKKEED